MKISEVLKLLSAGYKKADIDLMIEAEKTPEPTPELAPAPTPEPTPEPVPTPEPETDYKALSESLTQQLAEAQEKLKIAQAEVLNKDLSGKDIKPTTIADLQKIFR